MKKDKISFNPVAGYTIKEAIDKAIHIAQVKDSAVRLTMNDIVIDITGTSEFMKVMDQYQCLLKKRYEKTK